MKLVMTLLARDEEDVLDAHLAFHLHAGVDYVIATDHRSCDGTSEILARYERAGHVRVIRQEAERVRQSEWVTGMARLAALEHGADWVINSDADEFWWPCGGSVKEVLSTVPADFGVVHVPTRYFVPRPDDGRFFAERMIYRLSSNAPLNDPTSSFRPVAKIAHRGSDRVRVGRGGHRVFGLGDRQLRTPFLLDLLHLPLRSERQSARKFGLRSDERRGWSGLGHHWRGDVTRADVALQRGEEPSIYARAAVDDVALARALATGVIIEDTRLRDALRTIPATGRESPDARPFGRLPLGTAIGHAADVLSWNEANLARLARRLDELGARVTTGARLSGSVP